MSRMLLFLQAMSKAPLLLFLKVSYLLVFYFIFLHYKLGNLNFTGSYIRYAFGLISEYLSTDLGLALEKHLDLPPLPKSNVEDVKEPPAKRQKLGLSLIHI